MLFRFGLALSIVGLSLTGCSGAHLYDKERHALALQAESELKDLKISKALEPQRQRLAELSSEELDADRQHALAERDAEIITVLSSPADGEFGLAAKLKVRVDSVAVRQTKLKAELASLDKAKEALEKHRTEKAQELKKALDAAEPSSDPGKFTEKLKTIEEKAKALKDVPDDVKKALETLHLESLGLAAAVDVLEKQRSRLVDVLSGFLSAGTDAAAAPAADASKDARLAFALGNVYADLTKESKAVGLSAAALQNAALRLEIESAKRKIARAVQLEDLLRREAEVVDMERGFLREATSVRIRGGTTLAERFEQHPLEREDIFKVLSAYASAMAIGETTAKELRDRQRALRHEQVVDAAEDALAQWENLLSIPTSGLAALLGAGVKPEDVAQLIFSAGNVAGLFTIASNVK